MDFLRYAEASAALINAELTDRDSLRAYLADRDWLARQCTEDDASALRSFCTEVRPVFVAAPAGEVTAVISALNELLARHPITPIISDHDPDDLHLHVANRAASVADLLIGEALMGLATLVCDLGPTRLGVCAAKDCERVFVDTSPNRSRRYCSEKCSSRANVAAYRARQRAAAG